MEIILGYRNEEPCFHKYYLQDSDDEDDYDLEKGLDFADKLFTVASLRIDACAKAAFKMSRKYVCRYYVYVNCSMKIGQLQKSI